MKCPTCQKELDYFPTEDMGMLDFLAIRGDLGIESGNMYECSNTKCEEFEPFYTLPGNNEILYRGYPSDKMRG